MHMLCSIGTWQVQFDKVDEESKFFMFFWQVKNKFTETVQWI